MTKIFFDSEKFGYEKKGTGVLADPPCSWRRRGLNPGPDAELAAFYVLSQLPKMGISLPPSCH